MPYEDDYKIWLEKSLIEMSPDWVCDGMVDKEFTHKWCEKNCGKDNAYIMPKCLHMYYHHIVRADRKTEPQIKQSEEFKQFIGHDCSKCRWSKYGEACTIPCCDFEPKDELQTDCAWK